MPEIPTCIGLIGRLLGHRFEARYSEVSTLDPAMLNGVTSINAGALLAMRNVTRTYHGEVCTRCGESLAPKSN